MQLRAACRNRPAHWQSIRLLSADKLARMLESMRLATIPWTTISVFASVDFSNRLRKNAADVERIV
jgi:hypothetical protein